MSSTIHSPAVGARSTPASGQATSASHTRHESGHVYVIPQVREVRATARAQEGCELW